MDIVIAVDAGTSAVKAARIELPSRATTTATVQSPSVRSDADGLDATAMWAAVAEAVRGVVRGDEPVTAIVVTGQGDGFWSLDDQGAPGYCLPWNSAAAGSIVRSWESNGTITEHFRRSGTVLWPGTMAAIWRWLAADQPAIAERTSTVFTAKDWINHCLTGAVATDVTDASIPFLDMQRGGYDLEAIAAFGCDDLRPRLAPIMDAGEVLGTVHAAAAEATGVPVGTPVVMGCLDLIAMIHATGLSEVGDGLAILGSTAVVNTVADRLPSDRDPSGATIKLSGDDRYIRVLGSSAGTTTLEWYLRTLGIDGDDRHERFWALANSATQPDGPILLPFLAGERSPFLAPEATGAMIGLRERTGPADQARAVVEGITFALYHCLGAADAGEQDLVVSGGGAAAPWCQLVADVTERAVVVDDRPDLGALGAASLVPDVELDLQGAADADGRTRYEPDDQRGDLRDRRDTYLELVARFRDIWPDLER